ncbi:MAG: SURF1 family protein [Proteobacteria bacterium]|nr:SURF1 family protein [Pseudomonadota bacterium]
MRSPSINPWTRIALTLLLGTACAGLASLGFWQLHRAHEKQTRYQAFNDRHAAPPLAFDTIAPRTPLGETLWRRISVTGHYLDQHVVLDNRTRQGQPGYEVLTPFVADSGAALLVDRGWIPLPDSRGTVPDTLAPADPTTIHGYVGPEPTVGIDLDERAAEAEIMSPQVFRVQSVKVAGVESLLDRPLWPGIVYLDADSLGALAVDWQLPGDGSARNRSYAVQWFAMATVLAGIGLWNLYGKRRRHD